MLGSRTLLIEDADSQAGLVWLSVLDGKRSTQSLVVATGDAFCSGKVTIFVERIYAGDGRDLAALFINATGPCRENGAKVEANEDHLEPPGSCYFHITAPLALMAYQRREKYFSKTPAISCGVSMTETSSISRSFCTWPASSFRMRSFISLPSGRMVVTIPGL